MIQVVLVLSSLTFAAPVSTGEARPSGVGHASLDAPTTANASWDVPTGARDYRTLVATAPADPPDDDLTERTRPARGSMSPACAAAPYLLPRFAGDHLPARSLRTRRGTRSTAGPPTIVA